MRICAFDPGSIRCGYAVIDVQGATATYVESGVISGRETDSYDARAAEIMTDVAAVLDECKPDVVGVESQFVHPKFPMAGLKVAAIRGAIVGACIERGVPTRDIAPSTAKQAVSGNGKASKKQVQNAVRIRLKLKLPPEVDAADACAIALATASKLRGERRAA